MLRSVAKLVRQAAKGFTLDAQPTAVELFTFNSPKVVDKWHVFTDAYFGGRSQASLTYDAEQQAACFSGRVTLEQEEEADIKRAGYCVAASKVTHIADYFDLSGCSTLVLNVKGDGRTYLATLRTDSIAGTGGDVWQAPFRTRRDEWQAVSIPLQSLLLTYQGQLVQRRLEFQAHQVISVGVSASAMPAAEAQEAQQLVLQQQQPQEQLDPDAVRDATSAMASSSSSRSEGTDAPVTVDSSNNSRSDGSGSGDAVSSDSTGSSSSDSSSWPEHERFKLLIRSITAEVEE